MAEKKQDEGQVSEVSRLDGDGVVSDGDAVAGQPQGESGKVDEGPTGPDAVTNDPEQSRHPGEDEVETTG
jgi:hypothetical protein